MLGRGQGDRRLTRIGMAIVIAIGTAICLATDKVGTWLAIGIAVGIAIGAGLDARRNMKAK